MNTETARKELLKICADGERELILERTRAGLDAARRAKGAWVVESAK